SPPPLRRLTVAPPRAVHAGGTLRVDPLPRAVAAPGREDDAVQPADEQAGRQRVRLVAVVDLQFEADVPHGDAEPQRALRAGGDLAAHVDRVRRAARAGEVRAVAAAVHDELHQLVVHPEAEGAGDPRGVRGDELEVTRRDAPDRVAG